jgi:hypothetical protein
MTRQQYLSKEVTHDQYYASLAEAAGITVPERIVNEARDALKRGDEHLNSIPLTTWDALGSRDSFNSKLREELKRRGDVYSLSCGVCMRKALAKKKAI